MLVVVVVFQISDGTVKGRTMGVGWRWSTGMGGRCGEEFLGGGMSERHIS